MRKLLAVLVILLFVAAGIAFGALNVASVPLDFGFTRIAVPQGAALLGALVVGWLLGGLVAWLGMGARLRRHKRRAGAASATTANDS